MKYNKKRDNKKKTATESKKLLLPIKKKLTILWSNV